MPTPRLTLVARVSALYASVRPRIGSPGTSSTFEKKDTAWLCAVGWDGNGRRRGAAPQKPPNRNRAPAAARPFPPRPSPRSAAQFHAQQQGAAGTGLVVAAVGFVHDHRPGVLPVQHVVHPRERAQAAAA